jgi:transcription elongation factor Elf1
MLRSRKKNLLRRVFAGERGLDRCPECGHAFVCPMEWETDGDEHWLIELRCGECGAWRETRVTNAEAKAFDLALDRQCAEIVRALQRSDRERMETELSVFTAALARDLIDAGDFAR